MIPFFRKIRYKLAENNQFLSYGRYAIGEIVLVVVGILIALYINNWNEERKERERFDKALIEVEKELISNIQNCRRSMLAYVRIDSLVNRVLHDTLTINDYRNDSMLTLSKFLLSDQGFSVRKQVFLNLMEINGNIDSERDSIMNHLKEAYTDEVWGVESYDERIQNLNNEILNSYRNKEWFIDWIGFRSIRDDMIDFFMNDPGHRSNIVLYANVGLKTHHGYLERFEKRARKSYREIHQYLVNTGLKHSDSLLFTFNVVDYRHYVGTYKMNWHSFPLLKARDSVEIKFDDKKLIYTAYYPNGTTAVEEILPVNKFHFRFKNVNITGFHRVVLNEKNEVIGLENSQGGDLIKHKKIH